MPNIEKVIVVKRTGQPVQMKEGRDVWYHDALANAGANAYVEPESMKSPTHYSYFTLQELQVNQKVCSMA